MSDYRQLCTFSLDGLHFGIEISRVQEVIRHQAMTPVPLASPAVRGLINLRGQIVAAIDLRRRLRLRERPEGQLAMHVVVHTGYEAVSLLVDEVGEVADVEEASFEPPPDTLTGGARGLILGAYKLDGRLLLLLDIEQVVSPAEQGT
jgi:purine-binding chemotaxis protein CheW